MTLPFSGDPYAESERLARKDAQVRERDIHRNHISIIHCGALIEDDGTMLSRLAD